MNTKRRSNVSKKLIRTHSSSSEESISSSGDEDGFQSFYALKREERNLDDCSENETKIRSLWNNMPNPKRKSIIKNIGRTQLSRKRSMSYALMSNANDSEQTPIESFKKIKTESAVIVVTRDSSVADTFFQLEVQRLIASPANYSFQPVCNSCEIFSDTLLIIRCTGVCMRYFHRQCLNYPPDNPLPEEVNFQCPDCWNNIYSCNICKKSDKITSLLNCEYSDCGRLYHKACLDKSHVVYKTFFNDSIQSCPAHHCVSCVRENPSCIGKPTKKLFQCIRCPTAFHDDDLCMAAGSLELSLSQVICPRHFENDLLKLSAFKPIHPDWCFKCYKSGAKVKCQYCPNTFHSECIIDDNYCLEKKEGIFECQDCRKNKQPRYGEIMFVKVGQYRWWPCEVIHPRNAPMNILRLKRPEGTFPIMFLGSNEYQWVAKSRTIPYNIASLSPLIKDSGGSLKMDKEFNNGLEQAAKMHKIYVNILRAYVPLTSITAEPMSKSEIQPYINFKESDKKTVRYSLIKSNVMIQPAKLPLKKVQVICDCTVSCELLKCKNYLNKVECDKDSCPCNDRCHNHLFTNHANKNLGVNKTSNRGFGLKTTELLKENEFIIEYVGEIITKSMSAERFKVAMKNNIKDFYMMKLSGDLIVDAGPKGNLSRFINHSCSPNCRVERWIVNGYIRLGIFADEDISPDEELTFDYNKSGFILKEDIFCLCNAINCLGFLGPTKFKTVSPTKSSAIVKDPTMDFLDLNSKKMIKDESTQDIHISSDPGKDSTTCKEEEETVSKKIPISDLSNSSPTNIYSKHSSVVDNKYEKGDIPEKNIEKCVDSLILKEEKYNSSELIPSQDTEKHLLVESFTKRSRTLFQSLAEVSGNIGSLNKCVSAEVNDTLPICRIKGRHPKRDLNFDEFVRKCTPTINEKSDKIFQAENKAISLSKKRSTVTKLKSYQEIIKKSKIKDLGNIDKEAAEKVRLIMELTRKLERKDKSMQEGIDEKSDSAKIHQNNKDRKSNDLPFDHDIEESGTNKSSQKFNDKLAIINECLKSKDPPKEFARKSLLLNKSIQTSSPVKEQSQPYDDITKRLKATDAAIESLTKTIVIKDSSKKLDLNKEVKNVKQTEITPGSDIEDDISNEDSEYESYCFRCFDGGQLVLCDKKGCPKAYHLSCLGLKKAPVGTWYCPWHFCNICGEPSELFCIQCPGSYCHSHCEEGDMSNSPGSRLALCCYHSTSKDTFFGMIKERQGQMQAAV